MRGEQEQILRREGGQEGSPLSQVSHGVGVTGDEGEEENEVALFD